MHERERDLGGGGKTEQHESHEQWLVTAATCRNRFLHG